MNLADDDFALFALPRRFALDATELDERRRALQSRAHPDRHAAAGAAAQRLAMQWAVRINEAHARLKDPLKRAAYLCELAGVAVGAEDNTSMPAAFLERQLEWREALDDAESAADAQALRTLLASERERARETLARRLDVDHDPVAAANDVRALMFIERFAESVDERIAAFQTS